MKTDKNCFLRRMKSLRREIPLGVLLELMTKMQELGEEATPDAVKAQLNREITYIAVYDQKVWV